MSERVIDHGMIDDGTRWRLTAGGSDQRYSSTVHIEDDHGVVDGGGMGGPKLWGGDRLNVYTGGDPHKGPRGVVVRCHPSITRIVLVRDDGTSAESPHATVTSWTACVSAYNWYLPTLTYEK